MPKQLDSTKLTAFVRAAAEEIIAQTEDFTESVGDKTNGEETVSVMINGAKMELNQEDYVALKARNNAIRKDMKAKIKTLTNAFAEEIKEEIEAEVNAEE